LGARHMLCAGRPHRSDRHDHGPDAGMTGSISPCSPHRPTVRGEMRGGTSSTVPTYFKSPRPCRKTRGSMNPWHGFPCQCIQRLQSSGAEKLESEYLFAGDLQPHCQLGEHIAD
jgi:hypothetical protein